MASNKDIYKKIFRGVRLFWSSIIFIVGILFIIAGLIGFILPIVPGFLLILLGLIILGTEFLWARILLSRFKNNVKKISGKFI